MISDSKWQFQNVTRRNAVAQMVRTLIQMRATDKESVAVFTKHGQKADRVEVGPWISGFHVDLTGISRKTEKAVLKDLKYLAPNLHIETARKTKHYPRSLSIAVW